MNNRPLKFDVAPFIEDGRVIVPMRAIFEALGAKVEWNPQNRIVTAKYGGNMIILIIDSCTAFRYREGIDAKPVAVDLDVPPRIVQDRTMVPVRFVSESLDASVEWNNNSKTVYIKR